MRLRPTLGLTALFVPMFACGGAPPPDPVVKPPPLVITAKPPAPPRARWVFPHPELGLVAKVDVGDGSVLYVGGHGRRALGKGTDPLKSAETLAFDELVAVLKDDKGQFVFVADDGDTFVSKDPLGAFTTANSGPRVDPAKAGPTKLLSPTTGKASILAILPSDHTLVRSADFGATWKPTDYQGQTKLYGHPVSVALDSRGNGLLLHYPQRLFVTHDDGATWAPIASPGIGARNVMRDGAGNVYLVGFRGATAKLDGNALTAATDKLAPIYKPSSSTTPSNDEETERHTWLAGDRMVEFQLVTRHGKMREVRVASAKLGEPFDKGVSVPDLLGKEGFQLHVGAYGKDVIYLREDDDADADSPTSTVFLSHDYGATWQKDQTLQGVMPQNSDDDDDEIGPKGWAYVAQLCKTPYESGGDGDDEEGGGPAGENTDCQSRQIRPAGATAFQDMAFTEPFSPQRFVWDEPHDKVYVLGSNGGNYAIYESPLSQNRFQKIKFKEDWVVSSTEFTVDAKGNLRGFNYDYQKRAWTMNGRDTSGKDLPVQYLAIDQGGLTFAGQRGLLITHDKAWETADAGDNFMRVATSGVSKMLCSDSGCLQSAVQRIGWELPAMQDQEKIALQAEAPKPKERVEQKPQARPPFPQLDLVCKPSGGQTKIAQTPDASLVDTNAGDVRWASTRSEDDGRVTLIVGGKSSVRELPLETALPKPGPKDTTEHRSGYQALNDGVVAARYSFARSGGGSLNPVDVDFAWWSLAAGKTFHHTLAKTKAFRVSRYGFSGLTQIVDGGLLFQPEYDAPVSFLHEDGKVETIALPSGASIRTSDRFGKRWLLADWDGSEAQVSWSDDNAATWQHKVWGLDESASFSLASVAGKPTLAVSHNGGGKLLFGVDTAVPDDPPAPVLVETSPTDVACDATRGKQRFSLYADRDQRTVRARVESGSGKDASVINLSAATRIVHDTSSGKTCTAAYALSGSDAKGASQSAYLYLEPKGWSGWRFIQGKDPKDAKKTILMAEPLSCK